MIILNIVLDSNLMFPSVLAKVKENARGPVAVSRGIIQVNR